MAVAFAREKADVLLVYLDENEDAAKTREIIESLGRQCLAFAGDVADAGFCRQVVDTLRQKCGAPRRVGQQRRRAASAGAPGGHQRRAVEKTFRTNIFGMFQLTKAAPAADGQGRGDHQHHLDHRLQGQPPADRLFLDRGAITLFTRSLSMNLVNRGIRVNAVALARSGRR